MDLWPALSELNRYSNLVLAGLTLLLLLATAFYAWVSYRLLRESVDARHAAVRPMVSLNCLSIIPFRYGNDKYMAGATAKWALANHGRGPAIAIDGDVTYVGGLAWAPGGRVRRDCLEPFSTCEMEVSLSGHEDPKDNEQCLLRVRVAYQDLGGNLYELRQRICGTFRDSQIYWDPVDEDLLLLPFSRRSYMWPYRFGIGHSPDPMRRARVLYRRSVAPIRMKRPP